MNIAGSNNFPANVRVIDDGDTCSNAEHSATAQDLADRTVWLKTLVDLLQVFMNGGALVTADNVDWTINSAKKLTIKTPSLGTGSIDLAALAAIAVDRNLDGALFNVGPGKHGRANRKPVLIAPGAGTTDVDPLDYDTVFVTPSVSCTVRIAPSGTVQQGDWIQVINTSSSNSVAVVNPASASPTGDVSPLRSAASYFRSAVYVYADGLWRMAEASPHAAP